MAYEFAGTLYRNSREYHQAIATTWLSANGANSRQTMLCALAELTDEAAALEAENGWELTNSAAAAQWADEEINTDYSREALIEAIGEVRRRFDDFFPANDE